MVQSHLRCPLNISKTFRDRNYEIEPKCPPQTKMVDFFFSTNGKMMTENKFSINLCPTSSWLSFLMGHPGTLTFYLSKMKKFLHFGMVIVIVVLFFHVNYQKNKIEVWESKVNFGCTILAKMSKISIFVVRSSNRAHSIGFFQYFSRKKYS